MQLKPFFLIILLPMTALVHAQCVAGSSSAAFSGLNFHTYIDDLDSATLRNIESKVIVQYAINEDGSMGDMRIAKGLSPALDSEATKMVLSMPRPKPAMQDGKYVKVYFTQPIDFRR